MLPWQGKFESGVLSGFGHKTEGAIAGPAARTLAWKGRFGVEVIDPGQWWPSIDQSWENKVRLRGSVAQRRLVLEQKFSTWRKRAQDVILGRRSVLKHKQT